MNKVSYFASALCALLIGVSASAAAHNYVPNCCADTCDWSFCDGKMTAKADWLYWQTEQSNMNQAETATIALDNSLNVYGNANKINLDQNYKSGFRVGLGYEFPSNGWELKACYTNLPSHASASRSVVSPVRPTQPVAGIIIPSEASNYIAALEAPGLALANFGSTWDSNINIFDLDVGRTLVFGECFRLHPHIGFRAMWMDQKYRAAALSVPYEVTLDNDTFTATADLAGKSAETFNGYGVEAGLGASWNIGCGFSLVGHFGGSILYSKIKTQQSSILFATLDNGYDDETFTPTAYGSRYSEINLGTPSLDYFLGLAYTSTFCETELNLYAGWEQHVFFDVNQLFLNNSGGNLYTQGLTLGLRAAF